MKAIDSIKNTISSLFGETVFWAKLVTAFLIGYDINFFLFNYGQGELISNVMVEVHGLLFDLLLFGWILKIYEDKRQKNQQIERDKDLIYDIRNWRDKAATYKIVAAIYRLNKAGVTNIDASECFLEDAKLWNAKLQDADLQGTDLERAELWNADLRGADLQMANLVDTYFQDADLRGAKLQDAIVNEDWFDKLKEWEVKGLEEIKYRYEIELFEMDDLPEGVKISDSYILRER